MTYNPPADLKPGRLTLIGQDGNALAIVGAVKRSLRQAGNSPETIKEVTTEMLGGDYDHLLTVATLVTEEP